MTTRNYTWCNLDIACIKLSSIKYLDLFSEEVPYSSILVSGHSVFAFLVVAYGSFYCTLQAVVTYTRILPHVWKVEYHVYVKRQTRIFTTWPSFLFTCRLLFIISTHKLVVSRNFIHKNCFELFLSAHFLFWEILNLNVSNVRLTFGVCCIREAKTF